MKDGLENIDEVFKNTFDGFESNVDPSVWNNIQSSISSGSGGSSTPQVDPSTVSGVVGKSLVVKIVAGVVLIGAVTTAAFVIPDLFKNKEAVIAENIVSDGKVIEEADESYLAIAKEQNETEVEGVVVEREENEIVVNNNLSVQPNRTERSVNTSTSNADGADLQNSIGSNTSASTNPPTEEMTIVKPKPKSKVEKAKNEEATQLSVKINVDVVKGEAPLTVQFDAIGNGVQYFWDFSDGAGEVGNEPTHTFSKEGTYTVILKGIDENGNSITDAITIIVEKDYQSSIQQLQNIFTPNGDGQNDFIKVRGKNIKKLEVLIMDNKANIIYTIKSMDDFWDGKDKSGNYVAQGQYYMSGMAIGVDGKTHKIKQAINLRR